MINARAWWRRHADAIGVAAEEEWSRAKGQRVSNHASGSCGG
jgi:hypothetical protein